MTLPLSVRAADVIAATVARLLDGGTLRIYDGPRPVSADVDPSPATLLAAVPIATAGAPRDGVALFRAKRTTVVASGRAAWFRAVGADDAPVFDGEVGRELQLNLTTLVAGATVTIDNATLTVPR